ncbi:MAG TPA: dihydroorotase [Chitinophagales bacterium]|mgnify:FL=1|nr:dihydroorotase [Chitinophagales bacterium]HPH87244.1 dihydroorotase [Chitinophagales bacterium]
MTSYLLKNITVLDKTSEHNGKKVNVLIENGKIAKIGAAVEDAALEIIDFSGSYLAPGFCDLYVNINDPGFEYREDISSVANAAIAGGFTTICATANNHPITQTKAQVEYILNNAKNTPITILPIGAVTENFDGKTPTEMLDMHYAGAIAFSDVPHGIKDSGVLLRALQYVQPFNGLIITMPFDKTLVGDGQVNESEVSVRMGMKGITNLSEYSVVQRDIELLKYTGGKLHFVGISTKESIELIRKAKAEQLNVTCSVFVHHLISDESDVKNFDSNYKVFPPLRTQDDQQALIEGLKDGTIDCTSTQHTPLNIDEKNVEFEVADFGIIGLETAFGLLNKKLENVISKERLIELLSTNPRKIINQKTNSDFIILNFEEEYTFSEKNIKSKSKNTPYIGKPLKGKVKAVFSKGKLIINE